MSKKEKEKEKKTKCIEKLDKKFYEKELARLDIELVKLQEWVKNKKLKTLN